MTAKNSNEKILVGQKLRALREQKNFSVTDISSKMHLDPRLVNALEEDEYESLPDPIYIRGYIRGYSKLLGINADDLVNLYDDTGGGREPEIIPEVKHPSQTSSSDKPVKAFTYLISLGLVVLLIAWWQSNYVVDLPRSTANIPASTGTPVETAITTPRPEFVSAQLPAYTPPSSQTQAEPEGLTGMDAGSGIDINPDLSITASAMAAETTTPPALTDDITAPDPDPVAAMPVAPTTVADSAAVPLGPDSVVFNVTADSWIEVTDANNQRLYMNLARTGDTLTLSGTAPFDVLLGFAQGVTVEFNGSQFNQAPYSRAGVARFTLGESRPLAGTDSPD